MALTRWTALAIQLALLAAFIYAAAAACGGSSPRTNEGTATPRPLPSPVTIRQEPDGITLEDPAFEALPGATAGFGRLGGSVYQIEMPDNWNGRLLLFMHGYGELAPEARASAPGIRTSLILMGYAWGASSFSSTSFIPNRSADETAALWDFFVQEYGRPEYTYVTGWSMGGAASHIAAERYADRFDGALAMCGSAGPLDGLAQQSDFFVAAAYVAGVTQAEYDSSPDLEALITDRIRPALADPAKYTEFQDIMIDLTGGPRAFDREGFQVEEETNWERAALLIALHMAPNESKTYQLGPVSSVSSDDFNREAIHLTVNQQLLDTLVEGPNFSGDLQIPLMSLHTTGDGQVPIYQAQILQRRVDAAGKSDLLVQRVFRDPGHCGFNNAEYQANFEALVNWVEHGLKPEGHNVLIDDLRTLTGKFELAARPGTKEANDAPGAVDRVVARGTFTLDGAPLNARFLGAVVRKDGFTTPCQYNIPEVRDGRYEITIYAATESAGCGQPGAEVYFWTNTGGETMHTSEPLPWPGNGADATFDATFSTSAPGGAVPPVVQFFGDLYDRDAHRLPSGTRVEAYIGDVLCGVASTRYTGSFIGYILSVAGPDSVAGCALGATITFRVEGRHALQTAVNDSATQQRSPTDLIVP